MEDHRGAGELWEQLCCLFPDKHDQRLIYLTFHCGLKPREILRFCPLEFPELGEIYRSRSRILEQIRRNAGKLAVSLKTDDEYYQNV